MAQLSEEIVLKNAASGDKEAFGILYEKYVIKIFNYIYYRTGNTFDAEDLTERVFLRAYKHITNYNDRGLPFSAWLYRIAHNLVANWHRDNSRRKTIPINDGILFTQSHNHPEQELLDTEEKEHLLQLIRKLPPERQQVLILKYVEDLSNSEIGIIMGRSEGAIKSLYHRTLLSLRENINNSHEMN